MLRHLPYGRQFGRVRAICSPTVARSRSGSARRPGQTRGAGPMTNPSGGGTRRCVRCPYRCHARPADGAGFQASGHRPDRTGELDHAARGGEPYRINADDRFWEQRLGPGAGGGHPTAPPLPVDLAGPPSARMTAAGRDPPRDDGRAHHRRPAESGVPFVLDVRPGMFHGFPAPPTVLPEARQAMEGLGGGMRSTLANGKTFGESGGRAG
ncbi:alpha/beta hydrolase fold domain-containing protein [Streptomyces sp. NPDC056224]|uniref:alpha/beta hydrolase fold domain-containing protein n=1 Tax=Streptomyces sp. NPDC056224 TaxID=3345750 RepID=UPI0035DF5EDC